MFRPACGFCCSMSDPLADLGYSISDSTLAMSGTHVHVPSYTMRQLKAESIPSAHV